VAERAARPPVELRLWRRVAGAVSAAYAWLLSVRPLYVLGALLVVQWIAVLVYALHMPHNGWLFYQGGDQTYYYSSAWDIAHGRLPNSPIGYGWSLVLAPFALVLGANVLAALPVFVLIQTVVLLPIALLCIYGLGTRIGGRTIGYVAAVAWVAAPFVVIPGFVEKYHDRYVEQFLAQALGFTGLADFTSMVLVVVAAYFFLRALDGGGTGDAVFAGIVTGFAIGVKPANALFLAGPALAVLVARRWRVALWFGAALVPGALALALWKVRGLGYVPILQSADTIRVAASAAGVIAAPVAATPTYLHLDWGHLSDNMAQLEEFFWSKRLIEWLPIAGFVGLARVSWTKAAFVGGWLAAFLFVKGSSPSANVQDGTFFRLLMPAWPAYLLCVAALPLLVPGVAAALRATIPAQSPLEWRSRRVIVAGVALAAIPLLVMVGLRVDRTQKIVNDYTFNTIIPTTDFGLRASVEGNRVGLTWKRPPGTHGKVFYRVYVSSTAGQAPIGGLTDQKDGVACVPDNRGASKCRVLMDARQPTRDTQFVDKPPFAGAWAYRVALFANWIDDPTHGDPLLVSKPVDVQVGS
jgi:hypothetical protein